MAMRNTVLHFGLIGLAVVATDSCRRSDKRADPAPERHASASDAGTAAADSADPKQLLSDVEKKYVGAAIAYLQTVNTDDAQFATVEAGAQTGASTLNDIKDALDHVTSSEATAYVDMLQGIVAPKAFAALQMKIQRVKHLHDSAFRDFHAYWNDQNTSHIETGATELTQAVVATNDCIDDFNAALKKIESERTADVAKEQAARISLAKFIDDLNVKMLADWKPPLPDSAEKCSQACNNMLTIYKKSDTQLCMTLCGSSDNTVSSSCFATATTKAEADKCPDYSVKPESFAIGAKSDEVVFVTVLGCNLKMLKNLVADGAKSSGLGQAFGNLGIKHFSCSDGKTTLDLTYTK